MNLGSFAMLASIIASLAAVPAGSASITGDITAAGAHIANTPAKEFTDVPRTVSQSMGPDSMEKVVETPFGTATFSSEGDAFVSRLETPESRVRSVEGPETTTKSYTSSGVSLTVEESAGEVDRHCSTPQGTLESVQDDGATETEFSGVSRQQVREDCSEAQQVLTDRLGRLAQISADVGLVERELDITGLDPEKESVEITNTGPVPVRLGNWSVADEAGNSYVFSDRTLEPGESLNVRSGDAAANCDSLCWQGNIWNDGGDTASLISPDGEQQDSYSYGE